MARELNSHIHSPSSAGECMGEVRVRVRLTNAVDEALARRGALRPDEVRSYEAEALVDTGAVRTVLPTQVAERLGLGERGRRVAEYAPRPPSPEMAYCTPLRQYRHMRSTFIGRNSA